MSDKANPYFAATENGDLEFSFSPIVWGQDARAFLLDFSKLDIKGGTGFKYLGSPYTFSLEFSCECHHMGTVGTDVNAIVADFFVNKELRHSGLILLPPEKIRGRVSTLTTLKPDDQVFLRLKTYLSNPRALIIAESNFSGKYLVK